MKKIIVLLLILSVSFTLAFAQPSTEAYDKASLYKTGSFEVDDSSIKNFEIYWTSGDVNIKQTGSNSFKVNSDNPNIHWLNDNGTLIVRFCASEAKQSNKIEKYTLNIEVPSSAGLEKLGLVLGLGNSNLEVSCRDFEANLSVGESCVSLLSVPEKMYIKQGNGDLYLTFPENSNPKIKAPFGIGGRDISDNIVVEKESNLVVEMGVGNLTIR